MNQNELHSVSIQCQVEEIKSWLNCSHQHFLYITDVNTFSNLAIDIEYKRFLSPFIQSLKKKKNHIKDEKETSGRLFHLEINIKWECNQVRPYQVVSIQQFGYAINIRLISQLFRYTEPLERRPLPVINVNRNQHISDSIDTFP